MSTLHSTLQYLETLYPRLALIPAVAAGELLSFKPQTTRNKLHDGTFPVRTVLVGGKRLVRKIDLARYIDDELGSEKRPRGRPTKAATLTRERGGE